MVTFRQLLFSTTVRGITKSLKKMCLIETLCFILQPWFSLEKDFCTFMHIYRIVSMVIGIARDLRSFFFRKRGTENWCTKEFQKNASYNVHQDSVQFVERYRVYSMMSLSFLIHFLLSSFLFLIPLILAFFSWFIILTCMVCLDEQGFWNKAA